MNSNEDKTQLCELCKALEEDLLKLHGPLLTGEPLFKALGYISKDAFRQSIKRNTVPIKIFSLENRRGKYALAKDVAAYLAKKRYESNS